MPKPIINLRPYQKAAFLKKIGMMATVWRRQSGKSFTLACKALDLMMANICSVFFASASVNLGTENILKEAEVWAIVTEKLREAAAKQNYKLVTNADDDNGHLLDIDAIADLFEHSKLETRLWHNNTQYSRSKVVAPNANTAVGWTGHVFLDEVGRMPEFQDLLEAMLAIVAASPEYIIRLSTTPPPEDDHYSYEILAPSAGTEFEVNPNGNWYETDAGLVVHRVDAWDGYEAGVPLYDLKTREPLTPEEHRIRDLDRTAWDRNFALKFLAGGAAALSRMALIGAQERGSKTSLGINITDTITI